MGIEKERIIYVKHPMQFRSITVPDQAQDVFKTFTKEFLLPYQVIKSRVTPGKKKKIYLTRRELDEIGNPNQGKRAFNEEYFEDFFSAHGFEVVAPEKLSIEDQISLIMGADEIASTLGTLTHWVIFCKPTAKFIMLTRTENSISPRQCQLMKAFNFTNYYIVDASHNFMSPDPTRGVFILGSNSYWKNFVSDYFNENIEEDFTYLEGCIDDYVDFWCKKYDVEELKVITSLKNMCRRIIALEKRIKKPNLLTYQTHVHMKGWGEWIDEESYSNPLDQKLDIQAVKINFPIHKVYYSVYLNTEEGWSEEVISPEMAGQVGGHKPIYGMKVWLDKAGAHEFDIFYRMHKFDGTWTPWGKNGEELFSSGIKINSIQIKLKPVNIRIDEGISKNIVNEELENYKKTLREKKLPVGALVMNCNPFTLGHQYLVEYAASRVVKLYLFVVEEDKSEFPFEDRIDLVREGVKNFSNVEVLPSGKFIISQTTFSGYFSKAELQDVQVDSSEDVEIFGKEIAPTLGITIRFAGEEPTDNVTRQYNETMKKILPRYGVEFCEIPRKTFGDEIISASKVRAALKIGDFDKIKNFVPATTYLYLRGKYSGKK